MIPLPLDATLKLVFVIIAKLVVVAKLCKIFVDYSQSLNGNNTVPVLMNTLGLKEDSGRVVQK